MKNCQQNENVVDSEENKLKIATEIGLNDKPDHSHARVYYITDFLFYARK